MVNPGLFLANAATVMYIWRKGSIAGPPFKIPLMGPFIQALHPRFEAYLEQWASGPLSCVSVFHKYVPCCHKPTRASSCKGDCILIRLLAPKIRRPRLRPRHRPQSLQISVLRRTLHRTRRQGHPRPQSLGIPPGQSPRRVPEGSDTLVHQQGHRFLPPRP